jgi:Transposase IS66 family
VPWTTNGFWQVKLSRLAYRREGYCDLQPADAELNLPAELHSHGLRHLAAIEASQGSFEGAQETIERSTRQRLAKRQLEELIQGAAVDFDAFYASPEPAACNKAELLVLPCYGKGIVMRPQDLRPTTATAALRSGANPGSVGSTVWAHLSGSKESRVVVMDETGWRLLGQRASLWVAAAENLTVCRIESGRGFDEAALLIGKECTGNLVRDGWGPRLSPWRTLYP